MSLPYPARVSLINDIANRMPTHLFRLARVSREFRELVRHRWKQFSQTERDDICNYYFRQGRGDPLWLASRGYTRCLLMHHRVAEFERWTTYKKVRLIVTAGRMGQFETAQALMKLNSFREVAFKEDLAVSLARHGCVSLATTVLLSYDPLTDREKIASAFRMCLYSDRLDLCKALVQKYGNLTRSRTVGHTTVGMSPRTLDWLMTEYSQIRG